MKPHLDLAKEYWQGHLKSGALVIDATCGNGWDTMSFIPTLKLIIPNIFNILTF
jgi:hypothetical protein